MKKLFTLFSFSLVFVSCSTTAFVSPEKDLENGVSMYYLEGDEVALSIEDSSTVAFYGKREKKEIILYVLFINESENKPVNIIPENVKVYGIDHVGSSEQMHTYMPKRYLKKMQNRQNLALALSAFGKAMEDIDAGTSTTTAYGSAYGSDGTSYNFYGSTTTSDESEKRAAQAENQRELSHEARQAALYRNNVKEGLLMKTTLFPGSHIGGNIIIKYKSYDKYRIEIPVGNDVHKIDFQLIKI